MFDLLHDIKANGLGFPSLIVGNVVQRDKFVQDTLGCNEATLHTDPEAYSRDWVNNFARRGAVAIMMTSVGPMEVHQSDYIPSGGGSMVYALNPEYWGISSIGPMYQRTKIGQQGDDRRYFIKADVAVMAFGEESSGVLADLSEPE